MALNADPENIEPETPVIDDGGDDSPPSPRSVEDFARDRGWRPKDEFNGEADQWRDAETFIAYGLDRNRDLVKDIKHLRENSERMVRTTAEMTAQAVERAREEERERVRGLHRQAVADGDTDMAERALDRIAELAKPETQTPQASPDVETFRRDNGWFDADPSAQAVAVATAGQVAQRGGSIAEQLQAAREAVHKRFPEYAPAQPKQPASVSAPNTRAAPTGGRKKGFSDLPRDAQTVAQQLKAKGLISSVDAYASEYFSGKGA